MCGSSITRYHSIVEDWTLQKKCYPENFPVKKFSKKIGIAKKKFKKNLHCKKNFSNSENFSKNGNERQSLSGTFDEKVGTFSCQSLRDVKNFQKFF